MTKFFAVLGILIIVIPAGLFIIDIKTTTLIGAILKGIFGVGVFGLGIFGFIKIIRDEKA